jgi:hypothetical protein
MNPTCKAGGEDFRGMARNAIANSWRRDGRHHSWRRDGREQRCRTGTVPAAGTDRRPAGGRGRSPTTPGRRRTGHGCRALAITRTRSETARRGTCRIRPGSSCRPGQLAGPASLDHHDRARAVVGLPGPEDPLRVRLVRRRAGRTRRKNVDHGHALRRGTGVARLHAAGPVRDAQAARRKPAGA